ncbi:P-loop NTPase [Nocardioides caldifontis]|uniref:P-loop NTPase n=1 Tax=Nocardioides caldifontis TaxID=2588938 RepID=UPI0011DFB3B7|nr:P-loop NTPase [Nocardioides caldifontis]
MSPPELVPEPLTGRPLAELGLVEVSGRRRGAPLVRVHGLSEDPAYLRALQEGVSAAAPAGSAIEVRAADAERRQAAARALKAHHRSPGALGSTTRVYLVGSGKGGVGKSTVTANVAAALAADGQRVAVLDADVWGYSQPALFGVRQPPVAVPGLMLPVRSQGVRLMSIGFFVDDSEPVLWRGPMLHKALEQFLADVYWGADLDVLLVDLPPGTGDVLLTLAGLLPDAGMVVVTTPQTAARSVAARVGRMAARGSLTVTGVVENMSGSVFGSGGGAALAEELGVPLLAKIPLDEGVCRAGDRGTPAVLGPASAAVEALKALAVSLPAPRRSLVGRSLPLFT